MLLRIRQAIAASFAGDRTSKRLHNPNIGVPLGDWNHLIVIIGPRGYGKSQLAAILAHQLQRQGPAYVIAHDAGFRIPPATHNGVSLQVRRHRSRESVLAALNGRNPSGIHAWGGQYKTADGGRATVQPEQVLELAVDIADASKLRAAAAHGIRTEDPSDPRLHGLRAVPVVVIVDEGVMMRSASRNRLDPKLADFIISLRHNHVAMIMTAQGGNMIHYDLIQQATEVYIGKVEHKRGLKALEDGGIAPEILADLPTMPKFEFHHIVKE